MQRRIPVKWGASFFVGENSRDVNSRDVNSSDVNS